ncbi:hypothetical protein [Thalassobacillus pellis]|uniref:hypothetical protein n=1 Tax=Thalassobacillus pellis TaxID=748008 RepID=UPI001961129B|nr:hypothetical protein [Thalassobacillus pellis]MBM7553165.1 hypothetical protein [Thalassobacillus pellis]
MEINPLTAESESYCIVTNRVYDWVVKQMDTTERFKGHEGLKTLDFHCGILSGLEEEGSLTGECYLTDADGNPVSPTEGLVCSELPIINGRKEAQIQTDDGSLITLQVVKLLTQGFFVVRLSNNLGEYCLSLPQPFAVTGSVLLCKPEESEIVCTISDFTCDVYVICNSDSQGNSFFQQINVDLAISQSIQAIKEETLLLQAKECAPRNIPFK